MTFKIKKNTTLLSIEYLQTSPCFPHLQHSPPTPCSRNRRSRWGEWAGWWWRWTIPLLQSKTRLWNRQHIRQGPSCFLPNQGWYQTYKHCQRLSIVFHFYETIWHWFGSPWNDKNGSLVENVIVSCVQVMKKPLTSRSSLPLPPCNNFNRST